MADDEWRERVEAHAVNLWSEATGGHPCNWYECNDDGPTYDEAEHFRARARQALSALEQDDAS